MNYNSKEQNPKILNNFMDYLRMMNYSENTRKTYRLDLLCFFRFLKKYLKIKVEITNFNVFILLSVREDDIYAYLIYLNYNLDNIGNTRQKKLTAIRTFYGWLLNYFPSDAEKINPTMNISNIRKVERIPKCLTITEAKDISYIFTLNNTIYPLRNNMIISLFLNTGLRLSELSNLNVGDINIKERYLRLIGKGDKERKVFLNKKIAEQLLNYLKMENKNRKIVEFNRPLFLNHQGNRLNVWGIENVCQKAYQLMGLGDCGYSAHTLRHTFATIMYQQTNGDLKMVKEMLRHESIEATEIYTMVYPEKVKEAIDRNPLNMEETMVKVA